MHFSNHKLSYLEQYLLEGFASKKKDNYFGGLNSNVYTFY